MLRGWCNPLQKAVESIVLVFVMSNPFCVIQRPWHAKLSIFHLSYYPSETIHLRKDAFSILGWNHILSMIYRRSVDWRVERIKETDHHLGCLNGGMERRYHSSSKRAQNCSHDFYSKVHYRICELFKVIFIKHNTTSRAIDQQPRL